MSLDTLSAFTPDNKEFIRKMHGEAPVLSDLPLYRLCESYTYSKLIEINKIAGEIILPAAEVSVREKKELLKLQSQFGKLAKSDFDAYLAYNFSYRYAMFKQEGVAESDRVFSQPFFTSFAGLPSLETGHLIGIIQENKKRVTTFSRILSPEQIVNYKGALSEILKCQNLYAQLIRKENANSVLQTQISKFFDDTLPHLVSQESLTFQIRQHIQTTHAALKFGITMAQFPHAAELLELCTSGEEWSIEHIKLLEDSLMKTLMSLWYHHSAFKKKFVACLRDEYNFEDYRREYKLPSSFKAMDPDVFSSYLNQNVIYYAETAHAFQDIILNLFSFLEAKKMESGSKESRFVYNSAVHEALFEKMGLFMSKITDPSFLDVPESLKTQFTCSSLLSKIEDTKTLVTEMNAYKEYSTNQPLWSKFLQFLTHLKEKTPTTEDVLHLKIFQEQLEQMMTIFLDRSNSLMTVVKDIQYHFAMRPVHESIKPELVAFLDELTESCMFISNINSVIYESCYSLFLDQYFERTKFIIKFKSVNFDYNWETDIKGAKPPTPKGTSPKPPSPSVERQAVGGAGAADEEPPQIATKNQSSDDVLKLLHGLGFIVQRQKGSHAILKDEESERTVTLPVGYSSLKTATLYSILRQAGLK